MKILKWYSAIIVTFGVLSACVEFLDTEEFGLFFVVVVMFVPIIYYLWKMVADK